MDDQLKQIADRAFNEAIRDLRNRVLALAPNMPEVQVTLAVADMINNPRLALDLAYTVEKKQMLEN